MPSAPFPERPDSAKLFARNGVIEAEVPPSRLPRFTRCLQESSGRVSVSLAFGHDAAGHRTLKGSLQAPVSVLCQRCLAAMDLQLESSLDLVVVADEETRAALEARHPEADVLVDADDDLDVLALIEDELLLSLPSVPMHAEQDCNEVLNRLQQDAAGEQQEIAHPFAALAALKKAKPRSGGDKA